MILPILFIFLLLVFLSCEGRNSVRMKIYTFLKSENDVYHLHRKEERESKREKKITQ